MKNLAPIALFAYNRVDHVKKTVTALLTNDLVSESELFIFCDGPKVEATEEEKKNITATRKFVHSIKGFGKLHIEEQPKNLGLEKSILYGISKVFEFNNRIIVLEDDIQTSKSFLSYMNESLKTYEDKLDVMNISGYWFPVKRTDTLPETFFLQLGANWGWATWKNRWELVDFEACRVVERIKVKEGAMFKLNVSNSADYFSVLLKNLDNDYFTWDIFWHCAIVLNDGYSLFPNRSLVNNIGQDSSGTHGEETKIYSWNYLKQTICVEPQRIERNEMANKLLVEYFKEINSQKDTPLWKRVIKRIVDASKDKK